MSKNRSKTVVFIIMCITLGLTLVMSNLEHNNIRKWDELKQVNFSLSTSTSLIDVTNLPAKKYIDLVDKFDDYEFKLYNSNADWKPVNECSINVSAVESSTEIKCKNTVNGKESQMQRITNDTSHYPEQVVMALLRALEEISDSK